MSRRERVAADKKPEPLRSIKASSWFGRRAPDRKWIIKDWLPAEGEVTGLYGDGGIGKSFLAMLMQSVAALEQPWFGMEIEPVRSLGIYCEDSDTSCGVAKIASRLFSQ